MTTLVIYAHPQTEGHCSILLGEVLKSLKELKESYELIDLYKLGFDPVLHEQEHYTSGNKKVSEQVKGFQHQLEKTDRLVFIFPIWWSGPPAILKGWFDKVFTAPFAFQYVPYNLRFLGVDSRPVAKLKGKRAAVLVTMGSPWIVDKLTLSFPSLIISKFILGFVGIKAKVFASYTCHRVDEKKKKELRKKVRRAMKWLY